MGRPRKHATAADRTRAYRQRKALLAEMLSDMPNLAQHIRQQYTEEEIASLIAMIAPPETAAITNEPPPTTAPNALVQMQEQLRHLQQQYADLVTKHTNTIREIDTYNTWRTHTTAAANQLQREKTATLRGYLEQLGRTPRVFVSHEELIAEILDACLPEPALGRYDDLCMPAIRDLEKFLWGKKQEADAARQNHVQ